jgi:hypothetical protein
LAELNADEEEGESALYLADPLLMFYLETTLLLAQKLLFPKEPELKETHFKVCK